jgi:hypothetical protein
LLPDELFRKLPKFQKNKQIPRINVVIVEAKGDIIVSGSSHPDGIRTLGRVFVRVRNEDRATAVGSALRIESWIRWKTWNVGLLEISKIPK